MMKQRRSGNKRSQTVGNRRNGNRGTVHPPEIAPTMVLHRRVRFKATAASASDQLTAASLLDMLCVTPTAISGTQVANFVRIRSLEIWAPMAADLAPVTASIEWNGSTVGLYGKSVRHSDTSMGSAQPAHIKTSPPPGSQVATWFGTGVQNVAVLVYPINTVIDVAFDLVLRDDASAVAVTGAVAGATVGALYTRALNSPVNNNLVPASLPTI